jgi:hypothetical protein
VRLNGARNKPKDAVERTMRIAFGILFVTVMAAWAIGDALDAIWQGMKRK